MVFDVLIEWLTGNALDNVTGQSSTIVRIRRHGSGREDSSGNMCLQVISEIRRFYFVGDEVLDLLLETRGVREQIFERNRFSKSLRNFKVDVFIYVLIQVEFSLFDQLHH